MKKKKIVRFRSNVGCRNINVFFIVRNDLKCIQMLMRNDKYLCQIDFDIESSLKCAESAKKNNKKKKKSDQNTRPNEVVFSFFFYFILNFE